MEDIIANMTLFELQEYHTKVCQSMDKERSHSISDMIVVEIAKRLAAFSGYRDNVLSIIKEREENQEDWWWA